MADWQNYPLSLSSDICNPYLFHTAYSAKLLSANSKRLFEPKDRLYIRVIEVGAKGRASSPVPTSGTDLVDYLFTDFASLDEYLSLPEFDGTRIL